MRLAKRRLPSFCSSGSAAITSGSRHDQDAAGVGRGRHRLITLQPRPLHLLHDRLPLGTAFGQDGVVDEEFDRTLVDIVADLVAVFDQTDQTTGRGLGRRCVRSRRPTCRPRSDRR